MSDAPVKMPVRTRLIECDGDYAGFHAAMRVNISMLTLEVLSKGEDIYPTVAALIQDWNFVDESGQPIALGVDGLRALPIDLFQMLQHKFFEVLSSPLAEATLPGSSKPLPPAVSRRRRSSRK
jgi:hypothetical protein